MIRVNSRMTIIYENQENHVFIGDHGYKPDITLDSQDLNMCKYKIEEMSRNKTSPLSPKRER